MIAFDFLVGRSYPDNNTVAYVARRSILLSDAIALGSFLTQHTRITCLHLTACFLTANETLVIAYALRSNRSVTDLSLSGNKYIGLQGIKALADMLKCNSTIQRISVFACRVRDGGALCLAEALRENKTLTSLNIDKNRITRRGFAELASALSVTKTLKQLYARGNPIDYATVKAIAEAVPKSGLQSLALHTSKKGWVFLYKMLTKNVRLRECDFICTFCFPTAEFYNVGKHNGWLTQGPLYQPSSWLKRNKQKHAEVKLLALTLCAIRKFRCTRSVIPYDIIKIIAEYLYSTRGDLN